MAGFLKTPAQNWVKQKADDAIRGNFWSEPASDIAINFLIPFLDDKILDKLVVKWNVSEMLIDELNDVIESAIVEDWQAVERKAGDFLVKYINSPLGDAYEDLLFKGILSILFSLIKFELQKAKSL